MCPAAKFAVKILNGSIWNHNLKILTSRHVIKPGAVSALSHYENVMWLTRVPTKGGGVEPNLFCHLCERGKLLSPLFESWHQIKTWGTVAILKVLSTTSTRVITFKLPYFLSRHNISHSEINLNSTFSVCSDTLSLGVKCGHMDASAQFLPRYKADQPKPIYLFLRFIIFLCCRNYLLSSTYLYYFTFWKFAKFQTLTRTQNLSLALLTSTTSELSNVAATSSLKRLKIWSVGNDGTFQLHIKRNYGTFKAFVSIATSPHKKKWNVSSRPSPKSTT